MQVNLGQIESLGIISIFGSYKKDLILRVFILSCGRCQSYQRLDCCLCLCRCLLAEIFVAYKTRYHFNQSNRLKSHSCLLRCTRLKMELILVKSIKPIGLHDTYELLVHCLCWIFDAIVSCIFVELIGLVIIVNSSHISLWKLKNLSNLG